MLEEFEKRNADIEDRETVRWFIISASGHMHISRPSDARGPQCSQVEQQRKYLGGDAAHTVLVKGLDFALLEQAKAQAAASNDNKDEEELELAFKEASAPSGSGEPTGQKRSRADLLKGLKKHRDADLLEKDHMDPPTKAADAVDVRAIGKFKPIGFKPIGAGAADSDKTRKKKKLKDGGKDEERKKKRRKVEGGVQDIAALPKVPPQPTPLTEDHPGTHITAPQVAQVLKPEPLDGEVDIFADVGEYQGIDLGDDSDDEADAVRRPSADAEAVVALPPSKGGWFDDPALPGEPEMVATEVVAGSSTPTAGSRTQDGEEASAEVVRLQPLASSAMPSIKDIIAASEAAEKEEKRRARKEKNKKG